MGTSEMLAPLPADRGALHRSHAGTRFPLALKQGGRRGAGGAGRAWRPRLCSGPRGHHVPGPELAQAPCLLGSRQPAGTRVPVRGGARPSLPFVPSAAPLPLCGARVPASAHGAPRQPLQRRGQATGSHLRRRPVLCSRGRPAPSRGPQAWCPVSVVLRAPVRRSRLHSPLAFPLRGRRPRVRGRDTWAPGLGTCLSGLSAPRAGSPPACAWHPGGGCSPGSA